MATFLPKELCEKAAGHIINSDKVRLNKANTLPFVAAFALARVLKEAKKKPTDSISLGSVSGQTSIEKEKWERYIEEVIKIGEKKYWYGMYPNKETSWNSNKKKIGEILKSNFLSQNKFLNEPYTNRFPLLKLSGTPEGQKSISLCADYLNTLKNAYEIDDEGKAALAVVLMRGVDLGDDIGDPIEPKKLRNKFWETYGALSKAIILARSKSLRSLGSFIGNPSPCNSVVPLIELEPITRELKRQENNKPNAIAQNKNKTNNESRSETRSDVAGLPRNLIVYGAPGTGKSFYLEEKMKEIFIDSENGQTDRWLRVTFYPDYSYGDFVGTYKPTPVYRSPRDGETLYDSSGKELSNRKIPMIDYRFVPGPFLKILLEAKSHPDNNYLLLIEEINRADAASVFGDCFQLLDRDDKGEGLYSVSFSEEATAYLKSKGVQEPRNVRLPSNFYIWASMNSADQGVMPIDSAFKRRWTFEHIPLDEYEKVTEGWTLDLAGHGKVTWNSFRNAVNKALSKQGIPEDRLIGPFFMRDHELVDKKKTAEKILMYLREDVVRHDPSVLFRKDLTSFSEIYRSFLKENDKVFRDDIAEEFITPSSEDQGEQTGT